FRGRQPRRRRAPPGPAPRHAPPENAPAPAVALNNQDSAMNERETGSVSTESTQSPGGADNTSLAALNEKTRNRMRYINSDASKYVFFIVASLFCIFSIFCAGVLAFRLIEWYRINTRFKAALDEILSDRSRHAAGDVILVS